MRTRWVRSSAVMLSVVFIGLLASSAFTQGLSTNPIANQQRIMKLIGANWADIQAKTKAANIEAIAVSAETIAMVTPHLPALFPPNSLADNCSAKPEIWQEWSKFQDLTKSLETRAISLRDAAKAKDAAAVESQAQEFGAQACGACHTPFRKLPRQ